MKLWRYYLIGLVKGYALAAGLVLAIFFLFDVISEAESVGSGGYSFLDAAFVVLLKLPTRFVELSPIVAMLGIVYGLGVFSRNVELVAIRTTGISSARMAGVAVLSEYRTGEKACSQAASSCLFSPPTISWSATSPPIRSP
jgi:lipopolysaccharide export system permease protein